MLEDKLGDRLGLILWLGETLGLIELDILGLNERLNDSLILGDKLSEIEGLMLGLIDSDILGLREGLKD